MTDLHVQLDYRLDSRLNQRGLWQKRNRLAKEDRHVGDILWYQFQGRWPTEAGRVMLGGKLRITLTRIAPRPLDTDNLAGAFKSIRDGIAARLGVQDNDKRVVWAYDQYNQRPKYYGVRMSVEPV